MTERLEPPRHLWTVMRQCDDISKKWAGVPLAACGHEGFCQAAPPPLRVVCDDYLPKCRKPTQRAYSWLHILDMLARP